MNSGAAKLSAEAADKAWRPGQYPVGATEAQIVAGVIWFQLGSPYAAQRWWAAHSVRCLARFQKWETLDALVAKINETDAGCFQASELKFYFLNARLWLLIALARVAKDYPKEASRYAGPLLKLILDASFPHVLMKHFASQALLECLDHGGLAVSTENETAVRATNKSPFPRVSKKMRVAGQNSFFAARPAGTPEPDEKFFLDYDFDKYDVDHLGRVFGRPRWETHDLIGKWVHMFDAGVTSMYENGGREFSSRQRMRLRDSKIHAYGYQLGWHGLFLVAGGFLAKHPVTGDSYDEDPWPDWLRSEILTRPDGLWPADGMDKPPLDGAGHLLESRGQATSITGNKDALLGLIGIRDALGEFVVVRGTWRSSDGVEVSINSALVSPTKAAQVAKRLAAEDAFQAWLPVYEDREGGGEHLMNDDEKDFTAWIVQPRLEPRLDETDLLGTRDSSERPYIYSKVRDAFSLKALDAFGRVWTTPDGGTTHAEAWGNGREHEEQVSDAGVRLRCSTSLLRKALEKKRMELLVLVKLERFEKESYERESRFSHTIGVVRVKRSLEYEFIPGVINKVHETKY